MQTNNTPAILILADGTVFKGNACGKIGTTTGEIAFNTGMSGYQEIFTDPSYHGQIITMANAHIGNYGAHEEEIESNTAQIKGLVVKKFANHYSRYGNKSTLLQDFLVKDNVVGIKDVDTRALISHIRENGAQNAIISSENLDVKELKSKLEEAPNMKGLELASAGFAVDYDGATDVNFTDVGEAFGAFIEKGIEGGAFTDAAQR